jgi:CO/xanthine dehydrogenase Mo-binding subunit
MLRVDAADKAAGATKYLRDLPPPPGALHAALVRSPVPRGILRGIRPDPAFDWSSVVLATASDIPGDNVVEMHDRTMPLLGAVGAELRYRGEPAAVVAAPTPELAREAASRVALDIDPLPALATLDEAVAVFKRDPATLETLVVQNIEKGDLAAGFAAADDVYEQEYAAGHQEQLYLEPQGLDVTPAPDGTLLVEGSIQCPYFPAVELLPALARKPGQIRVRQTMMGGAFGGKEDYPSMLAGYAALPALKSGRPVRIAYDRHEDMLFTPKRHPVWVRFKTGFKRDGSLTALECDFILDGGAYMTISDVVMYRGILHCALAYRCPNVVIRGRVARTNSMPCGAFRGFGAPQAIWGLESHVDAIAARVGLPPHVWRLQNHNRPGDTTPTGQLLTPENGSTAVLETALARSGFAEKWRASSRGRLARGEKLLRGIGISFFAHGSAFTGDGEAKFKAKGRVELVRRPDGTPGLDIRVSSTEMGQGVHTVFTQIAADALSVPPALVRFPLADTGRVLNSGPTVASRTTMVVGNVVWQAATDLRQKLEAYASARFFSGDPCTLRNGVFRAAPRRSAPFAEVASAHLAERGETSGFFEFLLPPGTQWDQKTFKGDAYPGYSWSANVAEITVDPLTCAIRVEKVTAVIDIGRVINPQLAAGQVEGGLTQALGYSVMEKMATSPKTGLFDASRLQTYIVPTALDTPKFDISFVEYPYSFAPPGAKGLGELPMDGLAPAIANALEAATGARLRTLPLTPESLFSSLHPS